MNMPALLIENLVKTYPNGFQALKGINLKIEQGDFFSLLGPNGAGKSTSIGIISSLIKKTKGQVSIFGHDIEHEVNKAKACIGLVPQEINLAFFEKPEQIVTYQAGYYGISRKLAKERAEKYLKRLDLWTARDKQTRMLSGGMKRRLMIVRALVNEPRLLILDEPTAGVDIEIRRSMWDFLREINADGTTIILTTHYLEEAENLCRNIALIDKGEVKQQGPMRQFLNALSMETFIFYLEQDLQTVPLLTPYTCRLVDNRTLEVDVEAEQGINQLFSILSQVNIQVRSMKNKSNRLEELFLRLTGKQEP